MTAFGGFKNIHRFHLFSVLLLNYNDYIYLKPFYKKSFCFYAFTSRRLKNLNGL